MASANTSSTNKRLASSLEQARSQPSDSGGYFPQILDLLQGSKTGVSSGCLGETSIYHRLRGSASTVLMATD